jgi:hypothetical protein
MDAIDALSNAEQLEEHEERLKAKWLRGFLSEKEFRAIRDANNGHPPTNTPHIPKPPFRKKPEQPEQPEKSESPGQPYGVFPPEIWLLIMRECSTTSLKSLARTSPSVHSIASDQLLHTLVLGQGTLGRCKLDKALDNATMIRDPAAFSIAVLGHNQLRWYNAVKTVFVVYRSALFVIKLSALPFVCFYITHYYAPQDLDKFKYTLWRRKRVRVTLWAPHLWAAKHPIVRDLESYHRHLKRHSRDPEC